MEKTDNKETTISHNYKYSLNELKEKLGIPKKERLMNISGIRDDCSDNDKVIRIYTIEDQSE